MDGLHNVVETAKRYAADVDRRARFPAEAVAELRAGRLLAAAAPKASGGLGLATSELCSIARELARACAATAMVWSMHQGQLVTLCRFAAKGSRLAELAAVAVDEQWLIASATSESGSGGDLRSSVAAVQPHAGDGDFVRLDKHATTVSYGAEADLLLVTARRCAEAPAGDQVLVAVRPEQAVTTRTSAWDPMGMRGTCSPGLHIEATVPRWQVLPAAFGDMAATVMVPLTHALWAATWIGLASEALDRAIRLSRGRLSGERAAPPPAALAEARWRLASVEALLDAAACETDAVLAGTSPPSVGLTARTNTLKVAASETALQVASSALRVCGMAGYSESGPFSVARILRDLSSSVIMIANERINGATAHMLLLEGR